MGLAAAYNAPRTYVPDDDALVEGAADDEVALGVEVHAEYVVCVAREGAEACPCGDIPYFYGFVVGG